MRNATFAAFGFAALLLPTACDDAKKELEQNAADEVARLATLAKTDVEEVRHGLPEGAKKLGALLGPDAGNDLAGLQRAISAARAGVQDLSVAKSTFFSFTDATGTVLRSEADPDLLAGKNLIATFPGLKKALEPASGNVEVEGEMQELRGLRTGIDSAWVVAHPVVGTDNALRGVFVTGWSMRRFAFHLEDAAKRDLAESSEKAQKKSPPISYVFVVKGGKAYGAPLTPDVDAQAIEALKVGEKSAAAPFRTTIEVTGRSFGVAAQKVPELGADAAVAIMVSDI